MIYSIKKFSIQLPYIVIAQCVGRPHTELFYAILRTLIVFLHFAVLLSLHQIIV